MSSKLNIYDKEWLDVIFESRNKTYGAYELRRMSASATNKALVSVLFFVLLAVGSKFAYDQIPSNNAPSLSNDRAIITTVDLLEEQEKEDKKEDPLPPAVDVPQQIAQDPPAQELVRFPEAVVVDSRKVTENLATQDDLKGNKTPARISLRPAAGGAYVTKGEFGPAKKLGAITGVENGGEQGMTNVEIFDRVEVMPTPVDGMKGFVEWVAKNYQFPQSAIDQGVQGVVEVSFVVEVDGSLTDIKVKRDMGYNTGEEAIKLLKKAKKWNPGIQNGRPVRVSFSMPIRLSTI